MFEQVWMCTANNSLPDSCKNSSGDIQGTSRVFPPKVGEVPPPSLSCYVYHELRKIFIYWGPNALLSLVRPRVLGNATRPPLAESSSELKPGSRATAGAGIPHTTFPVTVSESEPGSTESPPSCCQGNFGAPFAAGDSECPQPHAGAMDAGFGNTTSTPCPSGQACQLFSCTSNGDFGTLYGGQCAPAGSPWFEPVATHYSQLGFSCSEGAPAAGGSTASAAVGASSTTAGDGGTAANATNSSFF
jgi:hypothetical protein